jgi:hypothetical protein
MDAGEILQQSRAQLGRGAHQGLAEGKGWNKQGKGEEFLHVG